MTEILLTQERNLRTIIMEEQLASANPFRNNTSLPPPLTRDNLSRFRDPERRSSSRRRNRFNAFSNEGRENRTNINPSTLINNRTNANANFNTNANLNTNTNPNTNLNTNLNTNTTPNLETTTGQNFFQNIFRDLLSSSPGQEILFNLIFLHLLL